MIYDDGVKTDKDNRVLKCPKCHNTQLGPEDSYCIICGEHLYNLCLGQPEYDDFGNYQGPGQRHVNPSNARFCAICGAQTTFFEAGYLKPYNEVQGTEDDEINKYQTDDRYNNLPF